MERNRDRAPFPIKVFSYWIFGALLTWWVTLVSVPLFATFSRGLSVQNLFEPWILAIARLTVWQAFLSTLISAGLGLPLGLLFAKFRTRASFSLLAVPYGVPTIVAGAAWIMWLGRSGIFATWGLGLDWAYSLKAVVLAHVFFNAPLIALLVALARTRVSEAQIEASRTLGAGPFQTFFDVVWPRIGPAWLGGMAQAFSLCTLSFALVLVLGGGPPVQTLEVALYGAVRGGGLDLGAAAGFAIWEVVITLAPWILWICFRGRGFESDEFRGDDALARRARGGVGSWGSAFMIFVAGLFLVPYLALGLRGFSLKESILSSLSLSVTIAIFSAIAAVVLAITALLSIQLMPRLRGVVEILILAPSGISVLVLGLGFFLAYRSWIDPFSGSLIAMILLQATLFAPLAFRVLAPRLAETRYTLLEAARSLGASPFRAFFDVEWPRWRAPLATVGALVVGASMGEVAAVSLFYSENWIPLPLLISRWIGQYRFEEARSLAFLLFLLSGVLIFGISYWGNRREN